MGHRSSWLGFMLGAAVASAALGESRASAQSASPKAASPPVASAPLPDDAAEEPPDYPSPSARWKVAGIGLGAAAAFYGAGAALSFVYPDEPGMKDLRIPVAGPWIGISHNGCKESEPDCSKALVIIRTVLMAIDGAAQAGSLAVMLEGLFMPTQEVPAGAAPSVETPRTPSSPPPKPAPGNGDKNLFFVPLPMTVGARGIGLGVTGRF